MKDNHRKNVYFTKATLAEAKKLISKYGLNGLSELIRFLILGKSYEKLKKDK